MCPWYHFQLYHLLTSNRSRILCWFCFFLLQISILCTVPLVRCRFQVLIPTPIIKWTSWSECCRPAYCTHAPQTDSRRHCILKSRPSLIWHMRQLNPWYCHCFLLYYYFFYYFSLFYSIGDTAAGDKPWGRLCCTKLAVMSETAIPWYRRIPTIEREATENYRL